MSVTHARINDRRRGADEAGLARVQQQLAAVARRDPRMVVTSVANAKRRNVRI